MEIEGSEETKAKSASFLVSDDVREQIVKQVEYYLSDAVLPTYKVLLNHAKANKEGYVPIDVIASFKKIKELTRDLSVLEAALMQSSNLLLSQDGKRVRTLIPHPLTVSADAELRTVRVEKFPDGYSKELIVKTFASIGNIKNIVIREPQAMEVSKMRRREKMSIRNKLHALIEYDTVEAAKKAVANLNGEKNWRNGWTVKLLRRKEGKYSYKRSEENSTDANISSQEESPSGKKSWSGLRIKLHRKKVGKYNYRRHKEIYTDGNTIQASEMAVDGQKLRYLNFPGQMAEQETKELLPSNVGSWQPRCRSQGEGFLQSSTGHGHGSVPLRTEGTSIPVLRPRIPDGTRGFTMGRGKPATSEAYHHNI